MRVMFWAVLAVFAWQTKAVTTTWQTEQALWTHALSVSLTTRGLINGGVACAERGDWQCARARLASVPPSSSQDFSVAQLNLSIIDQWVARHR